jgi:hypothetical protein
MNVNVRTAADLDTFQDTFTAELASAAYRIARRHGAGNSWLNLELDLWRAVVRTVTSWQEILRQAGSPDELHRRRERFLVEITEEAFHIAVKRGAKGPFLEVELDLYQAFRSVFGYTRAESSSKGRE